MEITGKKQQRLSKKAVLEVKIQMKMKIKRFRRMEARVEAARVKMKRLRRSHQKAEAKLKEIQLELDQLRKVRRHALADGASSQVCIDAMLDHFTFLP